MMMEKKRVRQFVRIPDRSDPPKARCIMADTIILPPPQKDMDFPLMKALELRRSKRKWKDEPVSIQDLSNLLWAACGITREETRRSKSRRTAPSATNSQEIRVYAALEDGLYLYEEKEHQLKLVHPSDFRKYIGIQKMMRSAPVGLIFVSDISKLRMYVRKNEQRGWFISGTDAGYISQNVYLYCAAAGLSTVVLGLVDRDKLHEKMGLQPHEKVVYTQVIGKSI
ncbi:MAG: SagB/ThcOx family dehydrogenase [Sediminispirochaetaceae bacterium]